MQGFFALKPDPLGLDLNDGSADAIQRCLTVCREIISPGCIEVTDVGGVADEDHGGGEFERSLAAVLSDVENLSVRRDYDDCVALVGWPALPSLPMATFQMAPRAVSATYSVVPSASKTSPLAVIAC